MTQCWADIALIVNFTQYQLKDPDNSFVGWFSHHWYCVKLTQLHRGYNDPTLTHFDPMFSTSFAGRPKSKVAQAEPTVTQGNFLMFLL